MKMLSATPTLDPMTPENRDCREIATPPIIAMSTAGLDKAISSFLGARLGAACSVPGIPLRGPSKEPFAGVAPLTYK